MTSESGNSRYKGIDRLFEMSIKFLRTYLTWASYHLSSGRDPSLPLLPHLEHPRHSHYRSRGDDLEIPFIQSAARDADSPVSASSSRLYSLTILTPFVGFFSSALARSKRWVRKDDKARKKQRMESGAEI
jgi:hypothetical protein